jgi:hypothetical protein
MTLRLSMHTRLARHGRHRCQACHRRRLAFSIVADSPGGAGRAESPRLCSECAGLSATGAEPLSMDDALAEGEMRPLHPALHPGFRPVLMSERLIQAMADNRDAADGSTVTWDWGEPDAFGFYSPTLTRHEAVQANDAADAQRLDDATESGEI